MLLVFDLDGTLIDSQRDLVDSTNEVLVRYGAERLPVDEVAAMIGDGARKLVERALSSRGLHVPIDAALEHFREEYDRRLTSHTRPYPGIDAAVRALSGHAPLAVLTNKPEAPARRLIEAFGWTAVFGRVVGGDGPFPRKPDPAGLSALMAQASAPAAATILVGDSAIDVETARRSGVRLCFARYGFGSARGPVQLQAADLVVEDSRDLGRVLGQELEDRSRP